MVVRGMRLLVLACCLPLVMPTGWCCFLLLKFQPKATTFSTTSRTTLPVNSAGLCCCCHNPQPQSQNDEKKPQEPRTPPLKHCPCSDRQTTPPSFLSVEYDDSGFVVLAFPPFSDFPAATHGGIEKAVPVVRPPACPIHVRNCVWRC